MKRRTVCCVALLGLFVSPALADIMVTATPGYQQIGVGETATVDVYADIPEAEGIVGFGFDANPDGVVSLTGFDVNLELFVPAVGYDGDGIVGLMEPPRVPVWGDNVFLGTLSYIGDSYGLATIQMGDDNPDDLSEGFALEPVGEFATVQYGAFHIAVPEPSALLLLVLGSVVLRRR